MITVLRRPAITLAVCGDPVICRALVLILRSPDYDVKYVPTASLGVSGSLAGVQVILVASERDNERRRTILELVEEAIGADQVHVLALSAAFENRPELRREHAWADHKISWPCSTEKLKRRIEVAMIDCLPAGGTAQRGDRESREG